MSTRVVPILIAIIAGVCVLAALHAVQTVMAPVAFALFTIAVVWPLQSFLLRYVPDVLATVVTVLITLAAVAILFSLMIWGFGRAAQWLVANGARFQTFYNGAAAWLETHDLYVASLFAEHFNISWMIRILQQITNRFHGMLTFSVIALVFVLLGLLEVRSVGERLESGKSTNGRMVAEISRDVANRFQRYMVIRTVMSVATGLGVWAMASLFRIDLALEWGLIAFVLNYIPFLGPLVATLFPTIFTAAQFESWQSALIMFIGLNLIQFVIGSFLEPRIAGARLSISPFLVLFSVFFWAFLWGIPGAFIGVPILIAVVTAMQHYPATKPLALVLSSGATTPRRKHL